MKNLILILTLITSASVSAEINQSIDMVLKIAAYHRIDKFTDQQLLNSDLSSETPGTIDIGIRANNCKYILLADNCSIIYHDQSYVDRGFPFNNKSEAKTKMIGFALEWKVRLFTF
jgi:hypothetical protein